MVTLLSTFLKKISIGTWPVGEWTIILFLASIIAVLMLGNSSEVALGGMATIWHDTSVLGFIALGVLVVFYVGEYDLSVGSIFALSLMLFSFLCNHFPASIALLLVVAVVSVIGYINGLITVTLNAALLITFTMMFILRGVVYLVSNGMPVTFQQQSSSNVIEILGWEVVGRVPLSALIFFMVVIGMEWFFRQTLYGRNLIAIGIDGARARYCGLKPHHYKIAAYIFAALMAFIASMIHYSRLKTASPNIGVKFPFDALAIVIMSNAGMQRLTPSPIRIVVITILLLIIQHHLAFLGFLPETSYLVTGGLVLATLGISKLVENNSNEKKSN